MSYPNVLEDIKTIIEKEGRIVKRITIENNNAKFNSYPLIIPKGTAKSYEVK